MAVVLKNRTRCLIGDSTSIQEYKDGVFPRMKYPAQPTPGWTFSVWVDFEEVIETKPVEQVDVQIVGSKTVTRFTAGDEEWTLIDDGLVAKWDEGLKIQD